MKACVILGQGSNSIDMYREFDSACDLVSFVRMLDGLLEDSYEEDGVMYAFISVPLNIGD